MSNVIKLNIEENSDTVKQAIEVLSSEIEQYSITIETAKQKLQEHTNRVIEIDVTLAGCTDNSEIKRLKEELKKVKAQAKQQDNIVKVTTDSLTTAQVDLGKLKNATSNEWKSKTSENLVTQTFEQNNLHYVINGQNWWMVDPDGDRKSPKIISLTSGMVKDTIFLDTDWIVKDDQELKSFAKATGRIFKHIVRDFSTAHRPATYNQMNDIRKYWLQPVYEKEPHPAFRLLTLSIAGGSEEYADQLERIVAYRYVHPEDVMIPNVDSCATGGTGRDTFFGIIRSIFTDECCATISEETFSGTHNGDLFGKMWVKVSEKDSRSIPIDKVKDLTGDKKYRHRAMGENAMDAVRLFVFLFFRNGYTTTAKLAGSGSSGEDRRFEPIIARYNLARHVAQFLELIPELKADFSLEDETLATQIIKKWQTEAYQNEEEIAVWLGYIIQKHNVTPMTELLPLHGEYYKEMLARQAKGIEVFMPKLLSLIDESNVLNLKAIHKLYEIAEATKVSKDWFKNQVVHWLNTKANWDCMVETVDVYPHQGAAPDQRRRFAVVRNQETFVAGDKPVFDVTDFIDTDVLVDGKENTEQRITIDSIRSDLL
jgi:hypothetical protein